MDITKGCTGRLANPVVRVRRSPQSESRAAAGEPNVTHPDHIARSMKPVASASL